MQTTTSEVIPFKADTPALEFRAYAEFAPVMMWMSGTDHQFVWFNKQWRDFTGSKHETAAQENWEASVHPEDLAQCLTTVTQAFQSQQSFSNEYRLRRADGSYSWIVDKGTPTFTEAGIFTGFIGNGIEIQNHKALELKHAKDSETLTQLYETILSANPDLIYNFDFSEPEPRFPMRTKVWCKCLVVHMNKSLAKP